MLLEAVKKACEEVRKIGVTKGVEHDKKYKKFLDELQLKDQTKRFKITILLLVFTALNNFKKFKNQEIIKELVNAQSDFEAFYIFKNNLNPSTSETKKFIQYVKKISIFFKKTTFLNVDFLEKHISFFFPDVDADLIDDFKPLQDLILSKSNSHEFYKIVNLLSSSLYNTTMNFKRTIGYLKRVQVKHVRTQYDLKIFRCILSMDFSEGILLVQNIDLFISLPNVQSLLKKNNKCVVLMKKFRDEYLNTLIRSSAHLSSIGSYLSITKNDFSKQENFMIIFTNLILFEQCLRDVTKLNDKNFYEFKFNILSKIKRKGLLGLAAECRILYLKIKHFFLILDDMSATNDDSFEKKISEFLDDINILFENDYFSFLMYGYKNEKLSSICIVLKKYLEKKLQ